MLRDAKRRRKSIITNFNIGLSKFCEKNKLDVIDNNYLDAPQINALVST